MRIKPTIILDLDHKCWCKDYSLRMSFPSCPCEYCEEHEVIINKKLCCECHN